MRVAVDDHVRIRKPAPQASWQPAVRVKITEAQRPQQRQRLFEPRRPVAVNEHDPLALDEEFAGWRQRFQPAVVVSPHRLDRGDPRQRLQRCGRRDVAGVEDEPHVFKDHKDAFGKTIDELRAVRVRDYADHSGHLPT